MNMDFIVNAVIRAAGTGNLESGKSALYGLDQSADGSFEERLEQLLDKTGTGMGLKQGDPKYEEIRGKVLDTIGAHGYVEDVSADAEARAKEEFEKWDAQRTQQESVKLTRGGLRSLIKEELSRLVEDPHGGGHTVGNGPTFTGAGPGPHPLRGFAEDQVNEDEEIAELRSSTGRVELEVPETSPGELGYEHGSSGVAELDGLGLAKLGYRHPDDLLAYQSGYDEGSAHKGNPQ